MGFQINTNIGMLKANNAMLGLNAKTEKAQIHLTTEKRTKPIIDDKSSLNVGKSSDQKIKQMQTAMGSVSSTKDIYANAQNQLISLKEKLSQIKAEQPDGEYLSADTITALDTSDFEKAIDNALGSLSKSVKKLDEQDDILTSAIANSQASVSRLIDADMAAQQLNATKTAIGGQASTAKLSQLNLSPQQVLQLLNS